MRERIVRLSGMRQGLAIAAALVLAFSAYQLFAGPSNVAVSQALMQGIFGAAFLVWAYEERGRGNRVFPFIFLVVGLA